MPRAVAPLRYERSRRFATSGRAACFTGVKVIQPGRNLFNRRDKVFFLQVLSLLFTLKKLDRIKMMYMIFYAFHVERRRIVILPHAARYAIGC